MPEVRLNTLYVTQDGLYLHHELEVLKVEQNNQTLLKIPIHHLTGIILMSYSTVSPSLIHKCLLNGISISYCTPNGRFLGRIEGGKSGNILLRKKQYQLDENVKLKIARSIIAGKLQNQRINLLRTARDSQNETSINILRKVSSDIEEVIPRLEFVDSFDSLRGFEGVSAKNYFSVFDHCIIQQKESFQFDKRSKRPPRSRVNALLSFGYSILTNDCVSACQAVGLDPFMGVFHMERPGRPSLALDLMEEFRPSIERFILTLINRKQIQTNHIEERVGNVYSLTKEGRKIFLSAYQNRKSEVITHHFLDQKASIGELLFLQSRILARVIRGDQNEYYPYIWR